MTQNFYNRLPSLTIPNGANVSNILSAAQAIQDNYLVSLYAPASLGTDSAFTFKIQVAFEAEPTASSVWSDLHDSAGVVIPAPNQGTARVYAELAAVGGFRIKSSSNVTADRSWEAGKAWTA